MGFHFMDAKTRVGQGSGIAVTSLPDSHVYADILEFVFNIFSKIVNKTGY